jgi:hypothetical protein
MIKASIKLLALATALIVVANNAQAASASVESACASDYFAYCSRHDPDSAATRSCMKSNASRLSDRCVKALVADGEVGKGDVARRSARK